MSQPRRRDTCHKSRAAYYNYKRLSLPRSLTGSTANVQAGPKLLKQGSRKALGKDVGILGCRRDMKDPNMTEGDPLPNKVEINLNMLRPLMLHQVAGEIHSTDIVTVDQGGTTRRVAKLMEQLA